MTEAETQLYNDLARQDDVGLVLRGHLHIEYELSLLISAVMPFGSRCDWSKIGFRAKVELAYACGLPEDVKDLLVKVGSLRNDFAHKLSAAISKENALNLYNSLSELHRNTLKETYKVMTNEQFTSPSAILAHDLVTLILLTAHSATKSATLALRAAVS